jgi:hypothetical protein
MAVHPCTAGTSELVQRFLRDIKKKEYKAFYFYTGGPVSESVR